MSPDIALAVHDARSLPGLRCITYFFLGDPCLRVVVSREFAKEHDISPKEILDLPEEYPAWHCDLSVVCERCLDELSRP